MATNTAKVSPKIPVDTKGQRVLFAELDKDYFMDVLFNLLSLPLGKVVRLLSKQGMVCSTGNLSESIENLNDTYMQALEAKDALLKLHVFAPAVPLLLPVTQTSIPTSYYRCSYCWNNVEKEPIANSPQCGHLMNTKVTSIGSPDADNQSSYAITLYKCNRNCPYMTDVA
ncbi:hypothetical protein SLA2020_243480 [Shorea laevis]